LSVTTTPIDINKATEGMIYEKNVRIRTRDGSYVMANVFRPDTDEPVPALIGASPYGKDMHTQHGYPDVWDDMLEQIPSLGDHSTLSLHTWETNDPEVWVPWGYACVRVDLPGAGKSPGRLDPLSPNEANATYDAIEWVAAQPWSNGKVSMTGISYLSMIQWRVAALRPPHLTCIAVWEGCGDWYRDWNRHGGILNTSLPAWMGMQNLRLQHGNAQTHLRDLDDPDALISGTESLSEEELRANRLDCITEIRNRELDEQWWEDRRGDYSQIDIPILSAANWGGQGLHLRGNLEGFTQSASTEKWLEFHGGDHRVAYYLPEKQQLQKDFFDHYLKGIDNGWPDRPRVLMDVRHADGRFTPRDENEWPLERTKWTRWHLDAEKLTLAEQVPDAAADVSYRGMGEGPVFRIGPFEEEIEITGPVVADLHVSSSTEDMDLFTTIRVLDPNGDEVTFLGSGEPAVPIAQGWLRASHRKTDPERSLPWRPWHTHDKLQKLTPGEIYHVQVEIWATCLAIPAGYTLELLVEGRDFVREIGGEDKLYAALGRKFTDGAGDGNDRSGIFRGSGAYLHTDSVDRPREVFDGTNTMHTGKDHPSFLLVPIIPKA
jgi:uncharacterized protein